MAKKRGSRAKKSAKKGGVSTFHWAAAVLATVLVFGLFAYAANLEDADADAYYRAVQEDEFLEWATFWAFIAAAAAFAWGAARARRAGLRVPWFHAGLAFFCFVVAMEEISWGQRVFGYRPPDYFLANNFQQELNVHNVISTDLRKLSLAAIILGYGVVLPLLALIPPLRDAFRRMAFVVPPLTLLPTYAAAYWVYVDYPWRFSGEWVEMTLGLSFLFTALIRSDELGEAEPAPTAWPRALVPLLVPVAAVALLGWGTTAISQRVAASRTELVAVAETELAALERDFRSGRIASRCGLHKRLYTFVEQTDQDYLSRGDFAALVEGGLPESRAAFLLDPWNSPYWLRHRCKNKRKKEVFFLYSFGPNRRRDSNKWEILGDDVGVYIVRTGV